MRKGDEWEDKGKEGERQQGKGNWSENEGGKMKGWPAWEGCRKKWCKKRSRLLSIVLASGPKVETK